VHKCPGTGLETSYETQQEEQAARPLPSKELPDVSKTKSLGIETQNSLLPVTSYLILKTEGGGMK